jgi:hypothetical protein
MVGVCTDGADSVGAEGEAFWVFMIEGLEVGLAGKHGRRDII